MLKLFALINIFLNENETILLITSEKRLDFCFRPSEKISSKEKSILLITIQEWESCNSYSVLTQRLHSFLEAFILLLLVGNFVIWVFQKPLAAFTIQSNLCVDSIITKNSCFLHITILSTLFSSPSLSLIPHMWSVIELNLLSKLWLLSILFLACCNSNIHFGHYTRIVFTELYLCMCNTML